jgi:hypothetical protein
LNVAPSSILFPHLFRSSYGAPTPQGAITIASNIADVECDASRHLLVVLTVIAAGFAYLPASSLKMSQDHSAG